MGKLTNPSTMAWAKHSHEIFDLMQKVATNFLEAYFEHFSVLPRETYEIRAIQAYFEILPWKVTKWCLENINISIPSNFS